MTGRRGVARAPGPAAHSAPPRSAAPESSESGINGCCTRPGCPAGRASLKAAAVLAHFVSSGRSFYFPVRPLRRSPSGTIGQRSDCARPLPAAAGGGGGKGKTGRSAAPRGRLWRGRTRRVERQRRVDARRRCAAAGRTRAESRGIRTAGGVIPLLTVRCALSSPPDSAEHQLHLENCMSQTESTGSTVWFFTVDPDDPV
jgi:hypothetical protein